MTPLKEDDVDYPLMLDAIEAVAIMLGQGANKDSFLSELAGLLFWIAESVTHNRESVPLKVLRHAFGVAVEYMAMVVATADPEDVNGPVADH